MKTVKPIFRGATSACGNESNDCTVRALSNAGDIPYANAHELLKKHGRKDNNGAKFSTMQKAYNEAGFTLKSVHGTTQQARFVARVTKHETKTGVTLAKILPKLGFGKYIINTTGHAVAVVDGKIIDTFDNPAGKRVIAVFKKIEQIEKFGE